MELKNVRRGRIKEYADQFRCEYFEGKRPWFAKCDVALPCATQNEVTGEDAQMLVKNGCICVSEGANMPTTLEGVNVFLNKKILYGPGKAANAGGVAVSGLEMSQNSLRLVLDARGSRPAAAQHHEEHSQLLCRNREGVRRPRQLRDGGEHRRLHQGGQHHDRPGSGVSPGRSRSNRSGGGGAVLPLRVWKGA